MAFSKQAKKELQNAVRRYNSMRTRFINQNHPTYEIPKADINQILKSAENTAELREEIKALDDLKKLTDFNLSQETDVKATVVQMRTFKRLNTQMKRNYSRELKRLQAEQLKAIQAGEQEKVVAISKDITNLKSRPADLSKIRTAKGLQGAINRYKGESVRYKKFKSFKPPEGEVVDKGHYIAALGKMGILLTTKGQLIYEKLKGLTDKEWRRLVNSYPGIFTLDFVYNLGADADAKINQILGALGESIDDLNSEMDYDEE